MRKFAVVVSMALALLVVMPTIASAAIHEKIAAACRAGGEEVQPPGQLAGDQNSFLRALQAGGIITSIDSSVPGEVTISFDLTKPSSKFMSAGFDLRIPDALGPGVDLILSPLPVLDPTFPGHANCHNLNS